MCKVDEPKYLNEVLASYEKESSNVTSKTNFLIYGAVGTGKTVSACTGPGPILVDQFDPGGVQSVIKDVRTPSNPTGRVIVKDFSNRIYNGLTFNEWKAHFNRMVKDKVFDHIGTYVIDSLTNWSEMIMSAILTSNANKSASGIKPQLQQYLEQQLGLTACLNEILSVPCNVVITAHIEVDKDEVSGKLHHTIMVNKKLKVKVPIQFSEVYITDVETSSKGSRYVIRTAPSIDKEACRTRIGRGLLDQTIEVTPTTLSDIVSKCLQPRKTI